MHFSRPLALCIVSMRNQLLGMLHVRRIHGAVYLCVPETEGDCATGAVANFLREEGGIGVLL